MVFNQELVEAIGRVTIAWGMFEHEMDSRLLDLRKSPSVLSLEPKLPGPFKTRAKLFKKSAIKAFPLCSPLISRIAEFCAEGRSLSISRNRLMHGIAFEIDPSEKTGDLIINIREKGHLKIYTGTLEEIQTLRDSIEANLNQVVVTFFGWGHGDIADMNLALPERQSLQHFHKKYILPAIGEVHHLPKPLVRPHRHPSFLE